MKIVEYISKQHLVERPGRQNVELMFHGTTSDFVPSIKKHGLLPDSPNVSMGYGNEDPSSDLSLPSYGGVYLTSNFHIAIDAAEMVSMSTGGQPVIVIVQYVSGSGGIDEDEIIFNLIDVLYSEPGELRDLETAYEMALRIPALKGLPVGDRKYLKLLLKNMADLHGSKLGDFGLQGSKEVREPAKKIIQKIKGTSRKHTNVRVTRPIKFSGKTRILDIVPYTDNFVKIVQKYRSLIN